MAISGPLLLSAAVALLAGVVSFASSCVVPLVPGYLAYFAGLVGADVPRTVPAAVGGPAPVRSESHPAGRWRVAGAARAVRRGFHRRLRVRAARRGGGGRCTGAQ